MKAISKDYLIKILNKKKEEVADKPMRKKLMLCGIAVIAVTIFIWWAASGTEAHEDKNDKIEITPVEIEKIRSIGQWEFLAISDEELVDTIRHGFFGDDELTRIYYGTLRLGVDLTDTSDDWITMDKDTVVVTLPPVKLLDNNFIDEARTQSFIEDGKWTNADRQRLTDKAAAAMRRRCLTEANIRKAQDNAHTQMRSLLLAMGFKYCRFN